MDSRAPRIQPSVLREDRIAARLARVMYRYRDCHQIERLIIHSDGGIDIRFRDPRPDHAHSSRSAVAHVGSMGPTTPRAVREATWNWRWYIRPKVGACTSGLLVHGK